MHLSILQKQLNKKGKNPRYTVHERLLILWHIEAFQIPRRKVSRYFGIARSTFYRWLHKIEDQKASRPGKRLRDHLLSAPLSRMPSFQRAALGLSANAGRSDGRLTAARKHYLQVTDEHFEQATLPTEHGELAAKKTAQQDTAEPREVLHPVGGPAKFEEKRGPATHCEGLMGDQGLEPWTR